MDLVIPSDILKCIVLKLSVEDMISMGFVCKIFAQLLNYRILWLEKLHNDYPDYCDCIDNSDPFEKLMFLSFGIPISVVNFCRSITLKDLFIEIDRKLQYAHKIGIFESDAKSTSISLETDRRRIGTRFWRLSHDDIQVTFYSVICNIKYTYLKTTPLYKVIVEEASNESNKDIFSCLENIHV